MIGSTNLGLGVFLNELNLPSGGKGLPPYDQMKAPEPAPVRVASAEPVASPTTADASLSVAQEVAPASVWSGGASTTSSPTPQAWDAGTGQTSPSQPVETFRPLPTARSGGLVMERQPQADTEAPSAGSTAPRMSSRPISGNTSIPASIRNNNPGAQWPGAIATRFGSAEHENLADGQGNKIARFTTPEAGAAAQFALLDRSYTGMTLSGAISKWSGGNSADAYASSVAKATGLGPDTVLTKDMLANPSVAVPLAKAMARIEAGRDFPMSDDQWSAAHTMFMSGGTSPGWNVRRAETTWNSRGEPPSWGSGSGPATGIAGRSGGTGGAPAGTTATSQQRPASTRSSWSLLSSVLSGFGEGAEADAKGASKKSAPKASQRPVTPVKSETPVGRLDLVNVDRWGALRGVLAGLSKES
ncbi:hypothetical protein [Xanthobacter sediminis]